MSRRVQISHKLKEEMVKEIYTTRIGPRKDDFESIKQRTRMKMTKLEIEELCYCLAFTVMNAGSLVRLTEVRQASKPQLSNKYNNLKVKGR